MTKEQVARSERHTKVAGDEHRRSKKHRDEPPRVPNIASAPGRGGPTSQNASKKAKLASQSSNGSSGSAMKAGNEKYPHLTKPKFWEESPALSSSKKVYATILHLRRSSAVECRPLVLLTGRRLPIFENGSEIQLDVSQTQSKEGVDSVVRFIDGGKVKKWSGSLDDGYLWMGRVLGDLMGTQWSAKTGVPKWILLPLRKEFRLPSSPVDSTTSESPLADGPSKGKSKAPDSSMIALQAGVAKEDEVKIRTKHIDWEEINRAKSTSSTSFEVSDLETLASRALDTIFRSEGSEWYNPYLYVTSVRSDLSIASADPRNPGRTIRDGLINSGETNINHPAQPILECVALPRPTQGGFSTLALPKSADRTFIIPELANTYPAAAPVVKAMSCLPAMMLALDDYLLASEMNERFFMKSVDTKLLLQALTAPVRVKGDVDRCYERLEFFGDSALKLLTTIDMYIRASDTNTSQQDKLLAFRQTINSNAHLREGLLRTEAIGYVRGRDASFGGWRPDGWTVMEAEAVSEKKRKRTQDPDSQSLGEKEIADVAEAFIGAACLSKEGSWDSGRAMCLFLGVPIESFVNWSEICHIFERLSRNDAPLPEIRQSATALPSRANGSASWRKAFETAPAASRARLAMGYTFQNPKNPITIIDSQMTISSTSQLDNYKILGEALLDFFEDIYQTCRRAGARELAEMKSIRTTKDCQAAMAIALDLISQLSVENVKFGDQVQAVMKPFRKARQTRDLDIKQGLSKPSPFWIGIPGQHTNSAGTELIPAIGDLLQATIGSIFLDSGADLPALRKIYQKDLKPFLDKYCTKPTHH